MGTQKLYQIGFSSVDAKKVLKTLIPAMDSGFNINTYKGDFSVNGEDATAVAEFLAERIKVRLSAKEAGQQSPAGNRRYEVKEWRNDNDYDGISHEFDSLPAAVEKAEALGKISFNSFNQQGRDFRPIFKAADGRWLEGQSQAQIFSNEQSRLKPEDRLARFVIVTLENTQTAAFADIGRNNEIARILRETSQRVEAEGVGLGFDLHDANGNAVGRVAFVGGDGGVPREPIAVSAGANGRVRLELDLRRDAFYAEGARGLIAASIAAAGEKIAAAGAEGGFLIHGPDGDVLGGVCLNRLPDDPERTPTADGGDLVL